MDLELMINVRMVLSYFILPSQDKLSARSAAVAAVITGMQASTSSAFTGVSGSFACSLVVTPGHSTSRVPHGNHGILLEEIWYSGIRGLVKSAC